MIGRFVILLRVFLAFALLAWAGAASAHQVNMMPADDCICLSAADGVADGATDGSMGGSMGGAMAAHGPVQGHHDMSSALCHVLCAGPQVVDTSVTFDPPLETGSAAIATPWVARLAAHIPQAEAKPPKI